MPFAPRFAGTARGLLRQPGFALGAVVTLSVAIGLSAAVFTVVDAALLRPLPFPEPERLSFLTREGDVSIRNLDLTGDGEPERVFAAVAEPSYFQVLAMAPEGLPRAGTVCAILREP